MNLVTEIRIAAALRAAARVWRAGLRPARWSFAAAVGVVAALSVPLMAAGTPSAAHTSQPVPSRLIAAQPTVSEGATNAQGERLLAGSDRYATAVLLAGVSLDAGDAATRDVLVVSGESLVDAVSAVSVAASRDAAIVLTATDAVPQVVAEFITNRGFDRVTVGGGTAAVSDTTAGELAALVRDNTPGGGSGGGSSGTTGGGSSNAVADAGDANDGGGSGGGAGDASGVVRRVAGATRFETAVAAARAAGLPGDWCDTGYRGAVVVSGESLVDGVIAAPVAYAWRLPLLFTEADALPEVVAEFLRGTANVRHVTVVGAPDDVSDAVVRDVARSNDIDVLRIDATTPAERSVELAEAVAHCRTQPVAPGQYALLDAQQPVDGVAAAAALANGLGAHGTAETLIPILAVSQNSLPQPVADYLAQVGRRHDTITLYPLGGVARMTPRVIDRAVEAAQDDAEAADDAADAQPVLSVEEIAAAHGANVVIEDGFIKLEPPYERIRSSNSVTPVGYYAHVRAPQSEWVDYSEWLAEPGVLDPYLWQPEIEVLEANVDHDGDGTMSADEKYPLGSPERARYMRASGGQAPPGATVLSAPDMATEGGPLNEGFRDTAVRYPTGIPVPPGAPDRLETTFEERQQQRKARFEAYSGGQGFGVWATDRDWGDGAGPWTDGHYASICAGTPETLGDRYAGGVAVPASTNGVTCETAADWYLWMCDTMNSPALASLNAPERWLETFRLFYAQWESQMPAGSVWHEGLEDAVITSMWDLDLNGTRGCTYTDSAAADQALREIVAWGSQPNLPYLGGNNLSRQDPDSAFWDAYWNRLLVIRNVAEGTPAAAANLACNSDVRRCSSRDLWSSWSLQAFDGQ